MAYAGFAVYHIEKGTISSGGIGKHIDREKGSEHTYRHADPSRRHLNKNYKVYEDRHKIKLSDAINERIKEGYKSKAKIRKNAVKYVTHILTGSHEDMKRMEENGTLKDWVKENYEFLSQEYGFQNIVRFTLHMDEKTPHLHAITIPLTQDGRLSAFEIIGNRKKMQERQDRYAERMEQFGLRRGVKSTGITHEGAKEYYTRMSLANEIAQEKTEDSIPMETQIKALKALNRKLKIENQKAYLPKRMRERVAHVGKYIKERDEILAEKKAIEQKISSYENEIKGLENKVKEEEKRTETFKNLYSERNSKISQYDSQINELKSEKERLLREKEEAESRRQEEMQNYKSSYKTLQTKIDFLKDKRTEMISEFSELVKEKKALEEKLALKTNDDEKNRLKNELAQAYFKLERYQTMPIYARFEETRGMMKTSGKVSGRFLFLYMWDYSQKELAEELLTYGFSRDIAEKIAYTPLSDFVEKNSYGHIEPKPYLERLGEEIKQNEPLMKLLKDKFKGMKQMQNNQEQTRRGIRR